ncbi:unnamed protein product [Didymodactylos carnosus]|uniref:Uncharacterized protein n=1 Tax=Didymodactylos carnosus TaxID=1234261 RepID=A0A814HMW8_9BILA|nr:unnamed protein product [Didymodactylos carnosus]CAF1267901.1 unnamed protein product [Didymodactylos carnosus]CAF3782882.1 unnamed protein product [Didymodactylos carnosus]CAF4073741.1 unnamed protein product [Didymodactylos carnosus]
MHFPQNNVVSSGVNTTEQIRNIFAEIQSQLPSVVFDSDDDEEKNDLNNDSDKIDNFEAKNEIQQQCITHDILDNDSRLLNPYPDDLLESLLKNYDSFLSIHPRSANDANQQLPSVDLQTNASSNILQKDISNENSTVNKSQKTSNHSQSLSMDLLKNIDFDKLNITCDRQNDHEINFSRPDPQETTIYGTSSSDVVLQRLVQHASKFAHENTGFKNLERALRENNEQNTRQKRTIIPETERKTIFLDLRHLEKEKKIKDEKKISVSVFNRTLQENPIEKPTLKSDNNSSDDDNNDEDNNMLWFEKRRAMKNKLSNS